MAPSTTNLAIRLTSPVVLLIGGPDYERARARRRRAAARPNPAGQHNATSPAPHPTAPSPSRGRSLAPSAPPSRGPSPMGRINEDADASASAGGSAFVPPTDRRGRSQSRRGESPLGAERPVSAQRGRSSSATPGSRVREPVTTGSGSAEEAAAADEPPPAQLRGLLTLNLSKPTRIKEINIKLKGIARTDWPEGIGPRRLDVMEENTILNVSTTFFSAATAPMDRRAASVDPSAAGRASSSSSAWQRTESVEPSGGRRAASMMPARDLSVGRAYFGGDSAIHANSNGDGMSFSLASGGANGQGSTLSRIASSAELNAMSEAEQLPLPSVIGREWGPSPAYEAVPSMPGSPVTGAVGGDHGSIEPLELSRRNPSLHATGRLRAGEHSPAPSRSPLGPSRVASNDFTPLNRTGTADSGESSVSLSSSSHCEGGESDPPSGAISPLSRAESRSESLNERGRPGRLMPHRAPGSSEGPSATSSASPSNAASPAPSIHGGSRRTSLANGSALPSALRNVSNGPPSSSRSASRGARFSLAGLSDALRGKSVSRTREASIDTAGGHDARGRRDTSPDTVRNQERGVSRGRKTALKSLRDALTGADGAHDEGASDDEGADTTAPLANAHGWKEFRAGTYTYPISLSIPGSLPPSILSDFGFVSYHLKATVVRAGALTSNLTSSTEVLLVSAPGTEDTEDSESIVVDRFWEQQARYNVALSGKAFPIGGKIPITIRLTPMAKIKLYRITATLEQKTTYYAVGRKLTRHETPKKFPLLRVDFKDPKEPLLPILSSDPNVLAEHPLKDWFVNVGGSESTEATSCLDPLGPWALESFIPLPDCSTRVGFSTNHEKANISVSHVLKVTLRVERGDDDFLDSKGKRKLWDVIIEAPVHILSCRCTTTILPPYTTGSNASVPGSPSGHGSGQALTPFSQPPDCGAHGPYQPGSSARHHVPLHLTVAAPAPGARSASRERVEPPTTTIEQTLLFERLVSGEVGTGGEVPPTYDQVQSGTADVENERGRQSTRVPPVQ